MGLLGFRPQRWFLAASSVRREDQSTDAIAGWPWRWLQGGMGLFFLLPSVGAIALGVAMLGTIKRVWPLWWRSGLVRTFALLGAGILLLSVVAEFPLEAWLGAANIIPFGIFATAIAHLVRQPEQLRRLAWLLVLGSVPLGFMGYGQLFAQWSTPEWWVQVFGWSIAAGGSPLNRMASGLMYANLYAYYLLIVLILALGLWIERVQHGWQTRQFPIVSVSVLSALLVVNSGALLLTKSRNGWLWLAIATLAFLVYLRWHRVLWMISGFMGAIAWASWRPDRVGNWLRTWIPFTIWGRLSGQLYEPPIPELRRSTQWRFCQEMIQARPLHGWGLRSFEPLYNVNPDGTLHNHMQWVHHPHNLFIMWGAELGVPLTIALCAWVAGLCYPAVRYFTQFAERDRVILFAFLLAFAATIGFNWLDITMFDLRTNLLAWLLLGAIAGIGQQSLSSLTDAARHESLN